MDLNGSLSIDELAEIYKNTVLEHGTPGNVIFVVKYGYQMVKNGWRKRRVDMCSTTSRTG